MERELKFGLTAREFALLRERARGRTRRQTNTYFDDAKHSLRKAGAGLRIRIEDGARAFLTFKCAVSGTERDARKGWHRRQEWESRLTIAKAKGLIRSPSGLSKLSAAPARALRRQGGASPLRLRKLGTIETERTELRLGRFNGELDRWKVRGRVFYELELETHRPQAARRALAALFDDLGIRLRPRSSTKLATLFRLSRRP